MKLTNKITINHAILDTNLGEIIEVPKKKDAVINVFKISDILNRFNSTQDEPRFVDITLNETNEEVGEDDGASDVSESEE